MKQRLETVCNKFIAGGDIKSYDIIKNGNINSSYDVTVNTPTGEHRLVIQRVNDFVFKKPDRIMKNVELITEHITKKGGEDSIVHFLKTTEGALAYKDDGEYWRVSDFVKNSVAYNECDSPEMLRSAGRAFGRFQSLLSDFDADALYETIPGFHDTRSRIAVLMRHVNENPCGRVDQVFPEIAKIKSFKPMATRLNELVDSREMPIRVTHNDTKINNLLFDKDTGEARAVIDLDTVMPGLAVHDFGDAIRFAACTSPEDEMNLGIVSLDIKKYTAFAEGFIGEVADRLSPIEIKNMALGAFTMTLEVAARFLDDYIVGDQYFKCNYRGHNLVRARCQLKLCEDMFEKLGEMNKIVSDISGIQF